MARLVLKRNGVLTAETFAIGRRVVIGRFDPESGPVDIDLGPLPEAAYVSRRHAEIAVAASGQWMVTDLGSRNGTFHRAVWQTGFHRVTEPQPVGDGDEIALGNACFQFRTS